jgi:hypothetical protein
VLSSSCGQYRLAELSETPVDIHTFMLPQPMHKHARPLHSEYSAFCAFKASQGCITD